MECFVKARHIMSRDIISVSPAASIGDAARLMLENRVSGLPVIDEERALVGIVTERDFLRRQEIGTERKRPRWLEFFRSPGLLAAEYVQAAGRKVHEIMSRDVTTVAEDTSLDDIIALMESKHIKRVPVMRDSQVVGIISRQNFVQAVANLSRARDPAVDDEHIRVQIVKEIKRKDWTPVDVEVSVKAGVVDIYGLIADKHVRQAIIVVAENVGGVNRVNDHLTWVDPMSGVYFASHAVGGE
jgi:CBS domain-containing protein